MKRRMSLKRRFVFSQNKKMKKSKMNKFIFILLIAVILIIMLLQYANKKVSPILLNYAEIEAKKLASIVISKAITMEIAEELNTENLFIISKDDKGEIKTIDFDPVIVNQFLLKAVNRVQINLKHLEDGEVEKLDLGDDVLVNYDKDKIKKGIFFEIPAGVVFNNSLLANLGPRIPVRFSLMGEIISNIDTKVTNYGINNALIEAQLNLKITEKVILPVTSSTIQVEFNIPLSLKIVQGTVPNYYFNGMNQSSSILSIPVE